MFSTTCCLDSTSHAATITAPAAPDGSTHSKTLLDVDPDRLEDQRGEPEQHAATERDEHVVDEPLAGEAHEVHAPLVRSERAAHVRVGDREPQHDGQMGRDEQLGGRVRVVRIEVDHERSERERRGHQQPSAGRRAAAGGRSSRRGTATRTGRGCAAATRPPRRGSRAARRTTWIATAAATAKTSASNHPLDERAGSSSSLRTSCFHSRPLCSRANSRDRVSRSPIRFTATRNASSAVRPTASSSAIWSRRCASSSSTSRPLTAGAFDDVGAPLGDLQLQVIHGHA